MKTRIKNLEECTKLFQIEIPHETVEKTAEEVYQGIKKIAKIPGFRPGTAPRDLLEKHYSKDAEEEILKRLVPEGYKKAVDSHKVIPISMPRISNVNFQKGKPLTFEAEVDIKPNIRIRNYKKIRVSKKRISVSQEETSETITRLQNMYAKFKDVERPIKKGDYAVCDVEAFMDKKPISKKTKNMWIMIDKVASLLGMGEKLIGLGKGESKEIEADLPETYPDKKYAGKKANFKILVNEVKEKEEPKLDDAFAKTLNAENLQSLKKEIESQLYARKEMDLKTNMKNQILEKLLKDSRFSVPSGMAKRQKEVLAKRFETELLQKGISKDEAKKKLTELEPKLTEDAKERVKIYFILDEIAEKENITTGDKDIEERIKSIAHSTGRPPEEVRKHYEEQRLIGGLAEEIKEDKVLDLLLKEAEVVDEK